MRNAIEDLAINPANPSIPVRLNLYSSFRLVLLYAILVAYSFIYEYFYGFQLTPLFHVIFAKYDALREPVYFAIAFLTPLAIVPAGHKLRLPGQYIFYTLAVILFIPIPIVFVPMLSVPQFWHVYALLWLSYLIVSVCSSYCIEVPYILFSSDKYRHLINVVYGVITAVFAFSILKSHFSIVSLADAHQARNLVNLNAIQVYILVAYVASFGGLLLVISIAYRNVYLTFMAFMGYIFCYGLLEERNAILMPAWLLYMYLSYRYVHRGSSWRMVLCIIAPFLIGVAFAAFIGTGNQHSVTYAAFTLANNRLFTVPAQAFNVYYNFFSQHPLTYWSHIGVVAKFVHAPYKQPLAAVMEQAYHLGEYNASFIETDGLAAAGVTALPFVSVVVGFVMIATNTCMRGLRPDFLPLLMAGPSLAMIDTGIGPSLLTNGLIALNVVILFMPRDERWGAAETVEIMSHDAA